MVAEIYINALKIQEQMQLKIDKKIKNSQFKSKFTSSYKKKVLENKVHWTLFYCWIIADDLFIEAIIAFDHFIFNGKPRQLLQFIAALPFEL